MVWTDVILLLKHMNICPRDCPRPTTTRFWNESMLQSSFPSMKLMWLQTCDLLQNSNGTEYEWGNTRLRVWADSPTIVDVLIVLIVASHSGVGPSFILQFSSLSFAAHSLSMSEQTPVEDASDRAQRTTNAVSVRLDLDLIGLSPESRGGNGISS